MISTRMRHSSNFSEEDKAREKSEGASTGRRVLVIEDEGRLRDMLQRAVRDMGFEINTVGSAEAGMRVLEDRPIDILILDLNLPGMGGRSEERRVGKECGWGGG